jgi:hypothetical protein
MGLSDAGLRQQPTKALYPDHQFPPWPAEDVAPRSLQPTVRRLFINCSAACIIEMVCSACAVSVIAHPGLANTPALEWNSHAKRNHGAQDNRVNKNKRVWNHASI